VTSESFFPQVLLQFSGTYSRRCVHQDVQAPFLCTQKLDSK